MVGMPIPAQSDFYRPILDIMAKCGQSLSRKELTSMLISLFPMSDDEVNDLIPSGGQTRVVTRINWAIYELKSAGLLHYPENSRIQITEFGLSYAANPPDRITYTDLKRLGNGVLDSTVLSPVDHLDDSEVSPEEQIAKSYQEQSTRLTDEILESVKQVHFTSFERLVAQLLSRMGYGEIVRETGHSGDQGFDGILNQDALGLEKVYVQAKRYGSSPVSEPEIRTFSGSLDRPGAFKGVFVTTSTFLPAAKQAAEEISKGAKSIRLIDGQELAQLMIRHGVGVVTEITYEVKKLDANYFSEI